MRTSDNPDLHKAMECFAERVSFKAIEDLFSLAPEEAYGRTIMTPTRREAQLSILQERLEKGILPPLV